MVQQALADGGMVSEPLAHYRNHRETYDDIQTRLDRTRESYLSVGIHDRLCLLFDSATYALLTARVPLNQADKAFRIYRDRFPDLEYEDLQSSFENNGIGFHRNKPKYIIANSQLVDEVFVPADHALRSGDVVGAQAELMNASGIGPAKSAFTLAMLGFDSVACLDSNVCRYLDVDPRGYEKHSARQYQSLVDETFGVLEELVSETSTFLAQWATFDLERDTIETHDLWFDHVEEVIQ